MRDKELIEMSQFFRLWDELFEPEQKYLRNRREKQDKHQYKQVFVIGLSQEVAYKLFQITKEINSKPSFVIETVLNDYFNVKKLK